MANLMTLLRTYLNSIEVMLFDLNKTIIERQIVQVSSFKEISEC